MLPLATPDAEISAVRFTVCVVAERYILQEKCLICPCYTVETVVNFYRASATLAIVNPSVCPSVCLSVGPSVCHTLELSQNDTSYDHGVFTGG